MPIIKRTPKECFDHLAGHVRRLIAKTVTARYPVLILQEKGKPVAWMGFMQRDFTAVPVETKYGRLYFYLGQKLEAVTEGKSSYRLHTLSYGYRIQMKAELKTQALLRWEYDAKTPSDAYCRHHVQLPAELQVCRGKAGRLDLDKIHLPTGWVTIEEVIRFLIVDLDHKPPCGKSWPDVLTKSEAAFFEIFTNKR